MKKKLLFSIFVLSLILVTFFSCTKEVAKLQGPSDAQMFAWASDTTHRFYYQSDSTVNFSPMGGSPHGPFVERYNKTAHSALGSDGKLPVGKTFNDSSLVVKVEHSGSAIVGYAVIFKLNNAWNWGEYSATGSVYTSVGGSASYCLSCHNGTGNRDQTLTFVYH